jgi:hypothetical protein
VKLRVHFLAPESGSPTTFDIDLPESFDQNREERVLPHCSSGVVVFRDSSGWLVLVVPVSRLLLVEVVGDTNPEPAIRRFA